MKSWLSGRPPRRLACPRPTCRPVAPLWPAPCIVTGVTVAPSRVEVINREFLKAGHLPTLLSAFFYFDMSFMVWVMLGPLAVQISQDLQLNAAQKGFMVALPVLAGALLRVVNGILVDRLRPRRAGRPAQVIGIRGAA